MVIVDVTLWKIFVVMHREALVVLGRLVSVVVLCQLLCAVFLTRSIQFVNSQVDWRQSLPFSTGRCHPQGKSGHLRDVLAIEQELGCGFGEGVERVRASRRTCADVSGGIKHNGRKSFNQSNRKVKRTGFLST